MGRGQIHSDDRVRQHFFRLCFFTLVVQIVTLYMKEFIYFYTKLEIDILF